MRYYSEELKKFYETEAECVKAEADAKKLADEKDARKKEIDEAVHHLLSLLKGYNRDYKEAYSVELEKDEVEEDDEIDLFDLIRKIMFGA